jgi:hypothetical protein
MGEAVPTTTAVVTSLSKGTSSYSSNKSRSSIDSNTMFSRRLYHRFRNMSCGVRADRYFAITPQGVFNGVYLYVEHDYRFSMLESNRNKSIDKNGLIHC